VVIIGGISYETPKLRDSQAGRGGCFPSFRVDRSHVNIAHLVVCNAKHTLVGSGTDDGLRRDDEKREKGDFFSLSLSLSLSLSFSLSLFIRAIFRSIFLSLPLFLSLSFSPSLSLSLSLSRFSRSPVLPCRPCFEFISNGFARRNHCRSCEATLRNRPEEGTFSSVTSAVNRKSDG